MENNSIKELPENERPQERLYRYGAEALSNSELLAIILRTGNRNQNVVALSSKIIKQRGGLNGLLSTSFEEYLKISGVGNAKASQLMALSELSKRFKSYKSGDEYKINSPESAAYYVMEELRYLKQEILKVLFLDIKNKVIYEKNITVGTLDSSLVHPREVFKEAIIKNSAGIILIHNHPSGDPTPSKEDIEVTRRIAKCGEVIGIKLVDHIIIGDGIFISLKQKEVI